MAASSQAMGAPQAVLPNTPLDAGTCGAEPNWEAARIDVQTLTAKLNDMASFQQAFEAEMVRAGTFCRRVLAGDEEQLKRIIHSVSGPGGRSLNVDELARYKRETQEVAARLGRLDSFIQASLGSIENIYRKTGCSDQEAVLVRVKAKGAGLNANMLDNVCVAFADVFACIKICEVDKDPTAAVSLATSMQSTTWIPPESFERSSKKFAVPQSRCFEVKLKVAEQIPVLVMDRQSIDAKLGVPADFLRVCDHSWVCSQYFDNDSFEGYHTRVQRLEGAKAYRIRWYNSPDPPKPDDDVYVERKTHHVEWVAMSSLKERFKLPCKAVESFLSGSDGGQNLSAKNQRLALEVQSELRDKAMKPVLRTMCQRTAFQSSVSNDVRVSFDLGVSFLDEKAGLIQSPSELTWCSSAGLDSPSSTTFGDIGVLEVKIKTGEKLPEWVNDLRISGAIIPLPNLSKFCHGICAHHYGSGKLDLQPYWFSAVVNGRLQDEEAVEPGASANQISPTQEASQAFTGQPKATIQSKWSSILGWKPSEDAGVGEQALRVNKNPTQLGQELAVARKPKRPPEAKTFFANERTLLQWISPVSLVLSMAVAMMGFSAVLEAEARDTMMSLASVMMSVAMVWLAYALYVFYKRMYKIRHQVEKGFDETFGPTMMVASLFFFCVLALILIIAKPFKAEAAAVVEEHLGRPCAETLANWADFPVLGVEPSGVIFHPSRGSLFVASGHHLLEVTKDAGIILDHPFPGLDIEAVTWDPNMPEVLYLGLEGPNQIVGLNINTMQTYTPVNLETVMGKNDQLEGLAVCPVGLCGLGGKRFLVGGPSDSLLVLDLGNYPATYPYGVKIIDKIDLDALLCRRIGRCTNRTGRITDLYISDTDIYALAEKSSEILKVPWSATAKSKLAGAPGKPEILPLPLETKGGWQGLCANTKPGASGKSLILANDFHGFVKEFHINAQGLLDTTC